MRIGGIEIINFEIMKKKPVYMTIEDEKLFYALHR